MGRKDNTSMRIKKFSLGGHDIKIIYVKSLRQEEREIFGQADPKTNTIKIATTLNGVELVSDVLEHTLHHELAHMMLILMNESELNANEQFVDVLGMFMHQFNKSKR